jgi:hypothetical protein
MTTSIDSSQSRDLRRHFGLRLRQAALLSGLVTVLVVGFQSVAGADIPERYPYDPACPWGRVADGNGMMVRCLDPNEAKQLLSMQGTTRPSDVAAQPSPQPLASPNSAQQAPVPPVGSEVGSGKLGSRVVVDSVGPAVADAGDLPLAGSKLSLAKDKFVQCVGQNGGLTSKQAKVVVRFLVRERGRAEGVSVKSHSGMSAPAAQCIAEVVNLRYVGYPAAPIVGATIPVVLSAQP